MNERSFSEWLRKQCEPEWTAVVTHPFAMAITTGAAADDDMRRYLEQDFQFVDSFTALLGAAVASADTFEARVPYGKFLGQVATTEEKTYFHRALSELGGRTEVPLEPVTVAFRQLMDEVRSRQDYLLIAAVLPGADDRRLGAPAAPDALLGESLSVALGLPAAAQRTRQEALAFAHLLCLPQVLLLHRHQDEGELLGPSPLVERLALLMKRRGGGIAALPDALAARDVDLQPQAHPMPRAGGQLPGTLSATIVEALRDCPYRFFSRAVLGLREADELDDEAQKRDYGNWLHDVLWHFHQQRPSPRATEEDLAALHALALSQREQAGIDEASFLPFEASFERFARHYVDWLHERDAEGMAWLEGEVERRVEPPELEGVALFGRIDRIDALPGGRRQLIDYKTSASGQLKAKVRNRLEDTQLAFYAALELLRDPAADPPPLEAMYLALDENSGLDWAPHPEVADTARQLLQHLAEDLRRLRDGAALPALGEGRVCEFCEARGLCRRDHWPDPLPETPDPGNA
jgi:ATP-dependent helicase/nuclease subunit B